MRKHWLNDKQGVQCQPTAPSLATTKIWEHILSTEKTVAMYTVNAEEQSAGEDHLNSLELLSSIQFSAMGKR